MQGEKSLIFKNLSWSFFYKNLGMGLSYISVPLVLNYVGEEKYGLWITLFSALSWMYNFDVGLGNGVKNKLSIYSIKKDEKASREIIATAYFYMSLISFIIVIVCGIVLINSNVSGFFRVSIDESYLKDVVFLLLITTAISFILNIQKQFYHSLRKSEFAALSNLIYQAMVIVCLIILNYLEIKSLRMLALVYGISNVISNIIFTFLFFHKNRIFIPSISDIKIDRTKEILGISVKFFVIQMCYIVIFTTDNLIISKTLGAKNVTSYNMVQKLFSIPLNIVVILLTPLWTFYAVAYENKDYSWFEKSLKKQKLIFLLYSIGITMMIFLGKTFLRLWLGRELEYSKFIFLFMGINTLIWTYSNIHIYILNGTEIINLQLLLFVIAAIINIPLSVFLSTTLHMGNTGIILATNLCILPFAIFLPMQVKRILNSLREKKDEK